MSAERILVIDDSRQIVQHLVDQVLPTFGFQASAALDGRSGMEAIREQKPDLIMLDLNLPEMTGLDILQTMVAESIDIPVILMTGYGSEKSAVEAFRLGVKDYLIKPFGVEEVVEAIKHALVETRLRHDNEKLTDRLRSVQADMRRRMNEMSALLGIGKAVAALLSVDQLLERVLEAAIHLTGAEESAVWLLEPGTEQVRVYTFRGEKMERPQQVSISTDAAIAQQVLLSGRPLRQEAFSGKGIKIRTGYHVRALLCVPLAQRGDVLGVLSVANVSSPRSFSERDEYLVSALADYAGVALQNAQTFQKQAFQKADKITLSTDQNDLRDLAQITRALASSLELRKVVDLAVEHIHKSWEIEASSIWLLNKQSGDLRILANIGTPTKLLKGISVPLGRGFVGHVAQTGEPIYTNSVADHPLHYDAIDHKTGFRTRSVLCAPLLFDGTTIGALQLLNKLRGGFDEHDMERAMATATAVAISVTNANLHRQSEVRRHQLSALLEHSPSIIVLISESDRIMSYNQQAREQLGIDFGATGRPVTEALPASPLVAFLKDAAKGALPQQADLELNESSVWRTKLVGAAQFGRVLIMERLPAGQAHE